MEYVVFAKLAKFIAAQDWPDGKVIVCRAARGQWVCGVAIATPYIIQNKGIFRDRYDAENYAKALCDLDG
jgi:hypothetical protein